MTNTALPFILALLICYSGFGQTHEELNKGLRCQQQWEYLNLINNISGTILFHQKAGGSCGIFSVASVSVIRTEKGDTIRVLEMCNTDKDFSIGSHIFVKSETKPSFRVDVVPYDPKACIIPETYFGSLTKK